MLFNSEEEKLFQQLIEALSSRGVAWDCTFNLVDGEVWKFSKDIKK